MRKATLSFAQRLTHWNCLRAFLRPVFLRSTSLGSRVKNLPDKKRFSQHSFFFSRELRDYKS
jgi:hypothetical protein